MSIFNTRVSPLDRPKISLVLLFGAWKLLLLCIAIVSPGPGYDTSTKLLHLETRFTDLTPEIGLDLSLRLEKLIRWDAIYFTKIARFGYTWEQEWAFGWGFTKLLALISKGLTFCGCSKPIGTEAIAGILVSHTCHLLSVLMLHKLTLIAYPRLPAYPLSKLSFLAACLHIISPAGMFLSAPCAESSFSLLNFAGFYLYAKASKISADLQNLKRDALIVFSGIIFGVATTFRANGLFSGLVIVFEAVSSMSNIIQSVNVEFHVHKLSIVCLSGVLMACTATLPQYLAYNEYCINGSADTILRPWCSNWVPSIYTWVQIEYWESGFLKYWTLSNVPLFVLATPMLYVLLQSGRWAWSDEALFRSVLSGQGLQGPSKAVTRTSGPSPDLHSNNAIARRFAVPQIVLAALALTSYHVQIITRLSSGYPLWYWWLASLVMEDHKTSVWGMKFHVTGIITRWMVVYAIVQGGLFASFLPPA